jgi:hypothetical protein
MKKDIPIREVLDVGLAFIPTEDRFEGASLWELFFVNLNETPLENLLINATGKSTAPETGGKATATLRYYIPRVEPLSSVLVEAILPEVLTVENTFWVSFQNDNYLFDKKYILEPNADKREEMWLIPLMGRVGIWLE